MILLPLEKMEILPCFHTWLILRQAAVAAAFDTMKYHSFAGVLRYGLLRNVAFA